VRRAGQSQVDREVPIDDGLAPGAVADNSLTVRPMRSAYLIDEPVLQRRFRPVASAAG
jgi:hypothetical protein